ncbi:MAG: alanine dehydrogenase [Actinobacteria bacterium RBG_19FT_COMBO_70_19]|nr:MAG: alanine dehydrogenase [Actinobacteria bacterium RBG_19FT_COMBO_70_19]
MIVGIPREVKDNEYRVAATPEGVRELTRAGHEVIVESGAGAGSALPDEDFTTAGARILPDADAVFAAADMIMKVKEPQAEEYGRFKPDHLLFTYLHLAADEALTEFLVERGVASVAYETVELEDGRLPLLAPMSEIAGRMAPQEGAKYLERPLGGRGVLMGGASGVQPASVVVIGAGMAGLNAAWIAAGMEAEVVVLDKNVDRLRYVDQIQRGRIQTVTSSGLAIERLVLEADLVIGAVLIPGAKAPHLVTEDMVRAMRPGSVIVDISIDQGGCVETAHVTTHSNPVYVEHDVVHYCVGNMPGAVPRTSTYALTNVTLPYAIDIASKGLEEAIREDPALALGVNAYRGHVTNLGVAEAHGMAYTELGSLVDGLA